MGMMGMLTVPLSWILGVYIAKWLGGSDKAMFFSGIAFAFVTGLIDQVWYLNHQKYHNEFPRKFDPNQIYGNYHKYKFRNNGDEE
jgi:hypothetical protein